MSTQDIDRLLPTASVIVECASSMTDRKEALATLTRRLENLAFVAPAAALPKALDIFRVLQSINEDLRPGDSMNEPAQRETPHVGIFWLVQTSNGEARLLAAGCPLNQAEPYVRDQRRASAPPHAGLSCTHPEGCGSEPR